MYRTFSGFLKAYCVELSGVRTTSLRKLLAAAQDNARVIEPLFALAAVQGKCNHLLLISEGCWFHGDYANLTRMLEEAESLELLLASPKVPKRYAAVLDAYRAQWDGLEADRRMNGLLRPRIAEEMEQHGITRYRLCKDLGLNCGNVYAYLAGDNAKVSNTTARRIFAYVKGM